MASLLQMSDDRRRHTRYKGRRRDVVSHDCSGGDNRISADGHSGQDRGSGADPHVPLNRDWLHGDEGPPLVRLDRVTGRDQVDLVGDHDLVSDVDGSVSGEHALVTYEDGPTDGDVQPVIRIEGRDEVERVTNGLADQFFEDFPDRPRLVPTVST